MSNEGVHFNRELDLKLKRECQAKFEETHSREEFMKIIGKNYLDYLSFNKDIVLCCYEDVRIPDEWCHRLVFAEWWQARTGMAIPELQDSSTCKSGKKPEAQQKQMTLFDLL